MTVQELPLELLERIFVESIKTCRPCDVLNALVAMPIHGSTLPSSFMSIYSLVIEMDRVYLRIQRPGLTYIDLKTEWWKLEHLAILFAQSNFKIRYLIIQNVSSDLSVKAFHLLQHLASHIKYEHQMNNSLKGFIDLIKVTNSHNKVSIIEANEINFLDDWPLLVPILNRKIFHNVKIVHLWMYSESIRDVLQTINYQSIGSPHIKLSTTLSLNPLVEKDMDMIRFLAEAKTKFHNLSIYYTLTIPTLDSLNEIWHELDLKSITKLVLQNTCSRFQYCYLNKNLNQLVNCRSYCIYVNGISTDYLNKYIPRSVNKMTLIFKQYNKTPHQHWIVPANITELNLFSRGPVLEMEQLLTDIDWTQSNVRGLSLEYQYNTRMLDRNIHISLPNTLEQLDVNFFSESLTLICDELPPILVREKRLQCGSQVKGVELVDKSGQRVELVPSTKRMVAI